MSCWFVAFITHFKCVRFAFLREYNLYRRLNNEKLRILTGSGNRCSLIFFLGGGLQATPLLTLKITVTSRPSFHCGHQNIQTRISVTLSLAKGTPSPNVDSTPVRKLLWLSMDGRCVLVRLQLAKIRGILLVEQVLHSRLFITTDCHACKQHTFLF